MKTNMIVHGVRQLIKYVYIQQKQW